MEADSVMSLAHFKEVVSKLKSNPLVSPAMWATMQTISIDDKAKAREIDAPDKIIRDD